MIATIELRRGLFADLPASGALAEPFFCTDTGQLFVWNGSAMVLVGPSAGGGGGSTFTFTQTTASATWVVVHNLSTHPAVTVVDSSGHEVFGDVQYDSTQQLTITFSAPFGGQAFLN